MNNYKISSLSFAFMVICLIDSNLLGMVFPYLIREAKTSVLFSLIISFLLGFVFIFVFIQAFNFLPEKNLSEKILTIFPKSLAIIINLLINFLVFLVIIIVFWRFSTFISSEYLTETPTFLISLLLASPIFLASFKDFDIASRCATIIIIAIIFLFIFSRIVLATYIDLENFKPILNNTFTHIGKGSIVLTILQMSPMFIALNIPKKNISDAKNINKALIISYVFSFFIISSIIITIVGVLGIGVASLYTFPSYVVLKKINILNFIKNIENFSVTFWIMFMSFTCAFSLVFIKTSIKSVFNPKKKILNIIMIAIFALFIGTILLLLPFESFINKYRNVYVFIPFIVYSLLLAIIVISLIICKMKVTLNK